MLTRTLRICNKVFLLLVVIMLGGCALTRLKEEFPEIYAMKTLPAQLDVIVDVTVLGDLSGKDLGLDVERNRRAAEHALERIDGIFVNAGYALNVVRSGYGLAWRPGAVPVYLAEDKKTTGLPYRGPEALQPGDPWIEDDARDFLNTLVIAARVRRSEPEKLSSQQDLWTLAHAPAPAAFTQLQSRYLLVAHLSIYDASAWKEAASVVGGIAVAAGTAAAGSPLVLVPFFTTSRTWAELVLYDTRTGEIAWSYGYIAGDDGEDDQRLTIGGAAAPFPAHPGREARYPRRR
jgi:hypothetical protein